MMNGTYESKVVSVVALDGHDEKTLLALVAGLTERLDLRLASRGIAGCVAGHAVVIGNAAMFTDLGHSIDRLSNWSERLQQHGEHVLFVAVDGRIAGFLGALDPRTGDNSNSHFKETTMQQSNSTADVFPTDATDLPNAQPAGVVELAHGD